MHHYQIFSWGSAHFLQPWKDTKNQWLATQFQLTKLDIELIVRDWTKECKQPIAENQIFVELEMLRNGATRTQGEEPLAEENPQISPYDGKDESSGTPTNTVLVDKRK